MSAETPPDRTGAATTVTREPGRFVIAVEGRTVGLADFYDDLGSGTGKRVFPHTEVNPEFQGRGLATILVAEALRVTRSEGLRIVPTCWMVAEYIDKHPEYAEITDRR